MEITSVIIGLFLGLILGSVIIYFFLKSSTVSRVLYDELNHQSIRKTSDLENAEREISKLNESISSEKLINQEQSQVLIGLKNEIAKLSSEHQSQNQKIEEQQTLNQQQYEQICSLQNEKQNLIAIKSQLAAEKEGIQTLYNSQKEEITKIQELAKNEFKNLANEILEEKSKKFTDANRENLDSILKPLGENLETFKKRVNEVYENEARERVSLNSTIKMMMEQTTKISQEANNLATALKGQTKMQGDWGEMILERILEDSGLTKDREYFTQHNIKDEEGNNQRPDFVLRLPGNQLVIIDSKVSLNAYERMISTENQEQRTQNLNLHIAAIKRHIDTLAEKRYDNLKESLDFTIMFVPIESAFLTAIQSDNQLWNYAYKKHIILLSPTNLIAYLKLISDVWKRDMHNKNAAEIARQAGALYDKFDGFVQDLLKVGKKMDDAKGDYEKAMNKLSTGKGNLVGSVQKLKQLGAKATKHLPEALLERANEDSDMNLLEK